MTGDNSSLNPSRTATFVILCVGTVAAVACAFGPSWMIRVGVGVALATAFTSVFTTWRQMDKMVKAHLAEIRSLQEQARADLREANKAHHSETMAMITRFNERKAAFRQQIAAAEAEIAELRTGLAAATLDAETKQTRISALNKIVSDLEKQLADDESVLNLPRRAGRAAQLDVSGRPLVYPTEQKLA